MAALLVCDGAHLLLLDALTRAEAYDLLARRVGAACKAPTPPRPGR
ncbi:hypothetical protein ACFY1B_50905 [Streptomyces mirabilis]